ncbi:MAG: F0F1 ATP synthase subunit B [Actinomycetota bacterium]
MTNLLILAAGEAEPTGLDLILPAVDELVWGTISFAVVVFFMMKYALPKIRETIAAREDAIQEAKETAESERSEAKRLLEEYKQQLGDARSEANRIIEESRSAAEQVRKDILAKSEKDAEAIVARAQEQIRAERQRTLQELQSQIADISIELAGKGVGRSVDAEAQREMVDAYIREVAGMGTNGGSNN